MNFIQAFEANKTKRVRRCIELSEWQEIGGLAKNNMFPLLWVFGDWQAEEPPMEIWVNVYEAQLIYTGYTSIDQADKCQATGRIACKRFIEVKE